MTSFGTDRTEDDRPSADDHRFAQNFQACLCSGATDQRELDQRAVEGLHALATLASSSQLDQPQITIINQCLLQMSKNSPDHVKGLGNLAAQFVVFEAPMEGWRCLQKLVESFPEFKPAIREHLFEALFDLTRGAPDIKMLSQAIGLVARATDEILKPPREEIEVLDRAKSLAYFSRASKKVVAHDETPEARREAAGIRYALLEKALDRNWMAGHFDGVLSHFPAEPSALGNRARFEAISSLESGHRRIKEEFGWIGGWEKRNLPQDGPEYRGLEAILDSSLRREFVTLLLKSESAQLDDKFWEVLLRADHEGAVSFKLLSERLEKGWDGNPSFEGIVDYLHSLVFERQIPVGLAAFDEGGFSLNVFLDAKKYMQEIDEDPQEVPRVVEALLRFEARVSQHTGQSQHQAFGSHLDRVLGETNRNELLASTQIREKLIVCLSGRGLPDGVGLVQKGDLDDLIRNLRANRMMLELVSERDPSTKSARLAQYVAIFKGDNPPFSILGDRAQPASVQSKFQSQTYSVLLRARDGYFGAWANTFEFRHTPIGKRCSFDEMAASLDCKLLVVPAADFNKFPGRGRVITDIDIDRVFPGDPDNLFDPYHKWKNSLNNFGPLPEIDHPGNIHALSNLAGARLTALRAGFAYAVPVNSFMELEGENMTYIDWNHHFDATGVRMASLVPTRAFHSFFNSLLQPYDPLNGEFPFQCEQDVTTEPPTIAAIRERAKEMGCRVGVVNLSAGSNVSGGLCDGFDLGSAPFREWENDGNNRQYQDGFGLSHKWHIQDTSRLTRKLWTAHERIYQITEALQHVRDLFKFVMGRDARGETNRIETTSGQQSSSSQQLPARMRKLEFLAQFVNEYRQTGAPAHLVPNLILAPMNQWSAPVRGPFVVDGHTGVVFQKGEWGKPFLFEVEDGNPSPELVQWWQTNVDPELSGDPWIAPRLVARENCFDLMKLYGYQGKN